jgi:hypothetical protein
MKFKHRIQMLFHAGPRFTLAEPGTDPLAEPEQYLRRRKRGGVNWLWWAFALAALGTTTWAVWGWWVSNHG